MLRIILIYGAIAGVIVGAPMLWGMLTTDPNGPMPENGALVGYASMLVALTAVFLGVKQYRDKEKGGVIKFLPALGVGLGISAVASLGWVIAWEISLAVTKFDFAAAYFGQLIEQAQAEGAVEKVAKLQGEQASFAEMYANPLYRVPITFIEMFPLGAVISLVTAGLLRNSRFLPARAA
jgi:pheromone shutdown protein TraB